MKLTNVQVIKRYFEPPDVKIQEFKALTPAEREELAQGAKLELEKLLGEEIEIVSKSDQ